ncbi:MAG: transglycosylase domain-containing protein [Hyphomicrobiales bacterium]
MNAWRKRRRLQVRRERQKRGAGRILLATLLGLLTLGSVGIAAGFGTLFFVYQSYAKDYVPIEDKLRQTHVGLTTIYDRGGPNGGVELGALPNKDAQLLNPVKLADISPWVIEATVSTEDNSFWDNPGVNIRGLTRAGFEYLTGGIDSGTGGSSITQQLIKNVYICPNINTPDDPTRCVTAERTIDRKLREIVYALELDQDYTKEQVLEWYLNQISYADRYIGIQAAAQGYFHKDAKDLTLAEAALLAGIPQAPTLYHPRLNCLRDEATGDCIVDEQGRTTVAGDAKTRQADVLDLMVEHHRATPEEAAAAKAEEIKVYQLSNPIRAAAWIDDQVQPRLQRMCEAGLLPKLEGSTDCADSVSSAGYKVTTTLDWGLTEQATALMNQFIAAGLEQGCECHNAAITTIEPSTGQVIVYAPNIDPTYVSDRRVAGEIDQLNEINQPGSSFKPAVYLTWFDEQKKAPMSTFWDTSPLTVEGTQIVDPRRDGGSEGLISARAGLGGSQNVPAFRAAYEAGPDNVIEMAKRLGITTLQQGFDPTFYDHDAVHYGASIATGGANIKAIDMAYMDATIANMGAMVGVPTLAKPLDMNNLKQSSTDDWDETMQQKYDFLRGNLRLPGTRELDPVVILRVEDVNGNVIYDHEAAGDLQRKQVVDAGSVWLLHSIMSDCTARFIIWGCGSSNSDLGLDFVLSDGSKVPSGVKTGTQQGYASASDTLETWMTGYTRYAATAVWVGNATNELVNDRSFAAANTTTKLWKTWMGAYHDTLRERGVFDKPANFDDLRPANVAYGPFSTPTTDRDRSGGGCSQVVQAWYRTDVKYESECEPVEIDSRNGLLASEQTPAQYRVSRMFVKLPSLGRDAAIALAHARNIPIAPTERSTGQSAVSISSPTNGRTLSGRVQVVGSVNVPGLKGWTLEIGEGGNPNSSTVIGSGDGPADGVLGEFNTNDLKEGVYTIRLTANTSGAGDLTTTVTVNIRKGSGSDRSPTPTRTPNGNGNGGNGTPTPDANEDDD